MLEWWCDSGLENTSAPIGYHRYLLPRSALSQRTVYAAVAAILSCDASPDCSPRSRLLFRDVLYVNLEWLLL